MCPIEAGFYLSLMQQFCSNPTYEDVDANFLKTYVMNTILLRRSSNYLAISPEMDSWAADYHSRLQNKQVKLIRYIQEIGPKAPDKTL